MDNLVEKARVDANLRNKGYRSKAMKMYPWVCGKCAREFAIENQEQLTVHHKDHNHDNNPADGSNWELLCLYCHDDEHSREADFNSGQLSGKAASVATYAAFENLKELMDKQKQGENMRK